MSDRPLGMFDSGVGGLSVAREVCRSLPEEDLLYVADTAHCPYGDRPLAEVRERSLVIGSYLEGVGAKLLVAACNTATGAALEALREALAIPVVGLEPAVKTAVGCTRTRRVGVLATAGTLASERFARLLQLHAAGVQVIAQPCPGLVGLIEDGHLDGPALEGTLTELTRSIRGAEADVVVLGCTHYPFVREALSRVLGPGVELVDSAPAIARRADSLLRQAGLRAQEGRGSFRVLTTGDAGQVAPVMERLWAGALVVERLEI